MRWSAFGSKAFDIVTINMMNAYFQRFSIGQIVSNMGCILRHPLTEINYIKTSINLNIRDF